MATAAGTFETIVGAFFDDVLLPENEAENEAEFATPEDRAVAKANYIAAVAGSEDGTIEDIANHYGVTIY